MEEPTVNKLSLIITFANTYFWMAVCGPWHFIFIYFCEYIGGTFWTNLIIGLALYRSTLIMVQNMTEVLQAVFSDDHHLSTFERVCEKQVQCTNSKIHFADMSVGLGINSVENHYHITLFMLCSLFLQTRKYIGFGANESSFSNREDSYLLSGPTRSVQTSLTVGPFFLIAEIAADWVSALRGPFIWGQTAAHCGGRKKEKFSVTPVANVFITQPARK